MTAVLGGTPGVVAVGGVRLRWIGHELRADGEIVVDEARTLVQAHRIAEEAQHRLLHQVPRLMTVLVHVDPLDADGTHHALSRHHPSVLGAHPR